MGATLQTCKHFISILQFQIRLISEAVVEQSTTTICRRGEDKAGKTSF